MEPQVVTSLAEQQFEQAYRKSKLPLYLLAAVCPLMFLWDLSFLIQELLWRKGSDFVIPDYSPVFFVVIAFIPQALLRRGPNEAERLNYEQSGSFPKSKWVTPLVVAVVLLAVIGAGEMFIWFFWQYPVTSWFTGRKY